MLYLEIKRNGRWKIVSVQASDQPPGTISHQAPDGRQIYMFSSSPTVSVIRRSVAGADIECGLSRIVSSAGWESVAELHDGDAMGFFWRGPSMQAPVEIRFRHEDG